MNSILHLHGGISVALLYTDYSRVLKVAGTISLSSNNWIVIN
jgi:hypothetical protein